MSEMQADMMRAEKVRRLGMMSANVTPSQQPSEMRADLMAVLAAASEITRNLHELRTFADQALRDLDSPLNLPAPALTEDAIVAALKADPAMAGRVMVKVAHQSPHEVRREMAEAARAFAFAEPGTLRPVSLQSLAGALAAASYRG